ncbi:hypothetical protein AV955_gp033 [Diadromus pulchellus ascovirus 4a]|uniref:Complete DpAV4 genome n=1 Tax=Diadromus pulchellus ascovirus 4a TaxID=158683 RepID=F2NYW2_9VIRU|nr:hypothetical protein AV955_gp033 [Diadromus pulchellus ascovirus 4a]CCA61390.1 unnamed protein product [Diadromus pulchellus ascovirus 4a]
MFISMTNFKCFAKARIELEDGTFTLVSAPSGFGKTTILDAIAFCLWNAGRDVMKIGKRKCEVVIEWGDLYIRRTKGPCFLEVKDKGVLVPDGEEFIRSRFVQCERNFVDQSSAKQMQMIERIVNSFEMDEKLDKIKLLCKEGGERVNKLEGRVEATKRAASMAFVPDPVDEPSKNFKEISDRDIECQVRRLDKLKSDLRARRNVERQLSERDTPKLASSDIAEELRSVQLDNARNEALSSTRRSIEGRLRRLANVDESEEEDLKHSLFESEEIESLIAKYGLTRDAAALKKIVSDAERSQRYKTKLSCPNCKCRLVNDNDVLIRIKDEASDRAEAARRVLNSRAAASRDIKRLIDQIYEKKRLAKELEEAPVAEELKSTRDLERAMSSALEYETLRRQLDRFDVVSEEDIASMAENIEDMRRERQTAAQYLNDLARWRTYETCKNNKIKLEEELISLEGKRDTSLSAISKLQCVKRCIDVAKGEAIASALDFLNSEIAFLIRAFFDEDDVDVYLKETAVVKSTKSEKPQISVNVAMRGCEMKMSNLSSGEMARVRLAVDMAYAKLVGSAAPVVLDECTANLDADISTKIFYAVKDYFEGKTVIVISHQAVEGLFDAVIDQEMLESVCEKS